MKQADDTKTIDAFDLPIIGKLRQIEQQIREKAGKIAELEEKIQALEKLGTVNASFHYKAGRYLYLIHPTHESGDRVRQYVGAQPEKIREAQESVNRYHEAQALRQQLTQENGKMSQANYQVDEISRRLKQNW